jgi:protein-S-isoprenylcysteine O-methyltransferase Ste14
MEEKKEEKAVEKKHGKGKGFAKCMEIITIPSYVLLVLILIFLVQILLFDYSFMPRFIVGVVILIAIAIIIFRVNKKACKK